MFETKCHSCKRPKEVPKHYAAKTVKCQFCGKAFEALSLEDTDLRIEAEAVQAEQDRKANLIVEIGKGGSYLALSNESRQLIERETGRLIKMSLDVWDDLDRKLFLAIRNIPDRADYLRELELTQNHERIESVMRELKSLKGEVARIPKGLGMDIGIDAD